MGDPRASARGARGVRGLTGGIGGRSFGGAASALALAAACALASCAHPAQRRAESMIRSGDLVGARELLLERPADDEAAMRALARTERGLAGWHAERGLESLRAGELDAARHSLELALAIDPDHPGARRGHAALRSHLAQRAAAASALETAIRESRWRLAFDVAVLLPPEEIARHAPALGVEPRGDAVLAEIRARLFTRLDAEVRRADAEREAAKLRGLVAEGERALARLLPGETAPDEALAAVLAEWRALRSSRDAADGHRWEAGTAPDGADVLQTWRLYRLARARCPEDAVLAEDEERHRALVRERLIVSLRRVERECDPAAGRDALELAEELDEEWPVAAPLTREEIVSWLAEDLEHRARDAERRGLAGAAILSWLSLAELVPGPEADHRAARLIERVRATPQLAVTRIGEPPGPVAPDFLEVALPPPRVEETVEEVRAVESFGFVRTGAESRVDAWRANDARRWQESLTAVLELREEWLSARSSRALLGERRFYFHLGELHRFGERLRRVAPVSERGVWRSQEIEHVTERRRMRVVQPLLLCRGGVAVAEMTVTAEEVLSAQLPAEALRGRIDTLPAGEAQRERIRLRLEAECRRRTPEVIAALRRGEVARGAARAESLRRAGEDERAIEEMVEAWLLAGERDGALRERAALALSAWTGISLETLARSSFP